MVEVTETVRIAKQADTLWHEIGRFGAVDAWHPMLSKMDSEADGTVRIPEDRDGNRQTERLLEASSQQRCYRYRIESTPLPVADWNAELRVADNRDGTSTVIWSAEFEPASSEEGVTNGIRGSMRAGLDHLAVVHGQAAA